MIGLPLSLQKKIQNLREQEYTTIFRGLQIQISENTLVCVVGILVGLTWNKEERRPTLSENKSSL
jgi:hypothetical protein